MKHKAVIELLFAMDEQEVAACFWIGDGEFHCGIKVLLVCKSSNRYWLPDDTIQADPVTSFHNHFGLYITG